MKMLLLVPTELERALLPKRLPGFVIAVCGFGPVDAAVGAALAIRKHRQCPGCVLAGVAGTYDPQRLPVGSVIAGDRFIMDGLGVANGDGVRPVEEMGLPPQVTGGLSPASAEEQSIRFRLDNVHTTTILTVAAASGSPDVAARRRRDHPEAMVEDMEAFAVARAARAQDVYFGCLRGISNVAGVRDRNQWKLRGAIDALTNVLLEVGVVNEQAG